MTVTDEYFEYLEKYIKEFGEKTCVMCQIGSFYEMQMVENDKERLGNLREIAQILNIQITKKNKNINSVDRTNPYMAGFPKVAINKFLPLLMDNGFTVVLVDQDDNGIKEGGKVKRHVSGIFSPGVQPIDTCNDIYGNNVSSIFLEIYEGKQKYAAYSLCDINTVLNTFDVYEKHIAVENNNIDNVLDDIFRLLSRYNPKEVLINLGMNTGCVTREKLVKALNLHDTTVHLHSVEDNQKTSVHYQNEFLQKIYKNVDFGLLSPIEYFDMTCCTCAVTNMIYTIDFIYEHDKTFIHNLANPSFITETDHLSLEMNTMYQLSLLPTRSEKKHDSVFSIIDKTRTVIGKRALKRLLTKPFKQSSDIKSQYEFKIKYEAFIKGQKTDKFTSTNEVTILLDKIADIEKLHRKMTLCSITTDELFVMFETYDTIVKMYDLISTSVNVCLNSSDVKLLQEFMKDITDTFLKSEQKIEFQKGNYEDLDEILSNIQRERQKLDAERNIIEKSINTKAQDMISDWVKINYTDVDKYHYTLTKARCVVLQKQKDSAIKYNIKTKTSTCILSTTLTNDASLMIMDLQEQYETKVKHYFKQVIEKFIAKYIIIMNPIVQFVADIDIANSDMVCRYKYKYTIPTIVDGEESWFDGKSVRHPIIERVNDEIPYVPNDILLNKNNKGMILYALNSCGKSSLLRSIGISIVLAQCGLSVPCDNLEFCPFDRIITQVDLHDNLWKGQSSFVSEMLGLKRIMSLSDEKTLVLADEINKGTEVLSATAIFGAVVDQLAKKNAKFVCTTHLHDVAKLDIVKANTGIKVCHLSIQVNGEDIIFERKLQSGPCSELYGLEIARAVGVDSAVIKTAFGLRDTLVKSKRELLNKKKSSYNSKKIVDSCEICNYAPSGVSDKHLHTHHINFQCTANENNFIDHFHKNAKHNLVILCEGCHQKVHSNEITIHGYIQTSKGVRLNFETQIQ